MNQLTFLSEEPHAKVLVSRVFAMGLPTQEATLCLPFLQSLNVTGLDGLSGKTSPVSCHRTEDGILEPSSGRWGSWGMGSLTECWTLNGSEWRNDAAVCLLSDILEASPDPKYWLSARACSGILRRAEKRGRSLPERLREALVSICSTTR